MLIMMKLTFKSQSTTCILSTCSTPNTTVDCEVCESERKLSISSDRGKNPSACLRLDSRAKACRIRTSAKLRKGLGGDATRGASFSPFSCFLGVDGMDWKLDLFSLTETMDSIEVVEEWEVTFGRHRRLQLDGDRGESKDASCERSLCKDSFLFRLFWSTREEAVEEK
jgi:hypothetical protein